MPDWSSRRRAATALAMTLLLSGCGKPDPASPDVEAPSPSPAVASAAVAPPAAAPVEVPLAAPSLLSFGAIDANRDGNISKPEHAAAWTKMFQVADTSGDGLVSVDEMDTVRRAHGPLSPLSSEKLINASDSDGDGALTLAEYVAASNTAFERRDLGGDGMLSAEEWNATLPDGSLRDQASASTRED